MSPISDQRIKPSRRAALVALVHVAKKQLCLTDEDYRAILKACAGVESAKDLTHAGFDAVIAHLRSLGFVSPSRPNNFGHRIGFASPGQIDLIWSLWVERARDPTKQGLTAWLEKYHETSALRFLDAHRAGKVIGSLRAWKKRVEARATHGPE